MRRVLAAVCGIGAVAAVATTAGAAVPSHGKPFSGSTNEYTNSSKGWKRGGAANFSFKTSADGGRILDFRGSYTYCGRSATLSAGYVTVASSGQFNYPFTVHLKAGAFYAQIYGHFLRGAKTAQVNYIVDFVAKGKKVSHPLDAKHPQSLGCASWVRATAKAG
jgi:hypothetical protein